MSTRTRTTALAGTLVLASLALAAPASPAAARGQVPATGTQAERKEYVVLATNEASVAAAQAAVVAAGGQVTAVNTDVGLLTVEAPGDGLRRCGERRTRRSRAWPRTGPSARRPRTAARPAGRTSRR